MKNLYIFAQQKLLMMLRMTLHIEIVNRFSPKGDYWIAGALYAVE